MNTNKINANKLAETKIINAMGDITRATKKVLMDYVISMYLVSFAKVIAYLGAESDEGKDLLSGMDDKTRNTVLSFSKDFTKTDSKVTAEVEHILNASGMDFEKDYKIIKKYLLHTSNIFTEKTIKNFREETPIFQKKLNIFIFNFDDILMLDDRAIQKVLQKVDQQTLAKALKGTDTEIQAKFFRNMSRRTASMLKEDMEWMGPVHLSDVENCQSEILKIISHLEDKGEIIISKIRISDILVD